MSKNASLTKKKKPFHIMFEMRFTQRNILQTLRYKEQKTTHGTYKKPKS